MRAVLGFDAGGLGVGAEEAQRTLERLPASRRRVQFEAPLAMIANLQGAWASTEPADYHVVHSSLETQLALARGSDETYEIEWSGYVNRTVSRIVQLLGERGHRVMAFLPRSRHDSFSVAESLPGFASNDRVSLSAEVRALLDLSRYELGVDSALSELLARGVAVHTSAMIREEQRACELAFAGHSARALLATGTLAQGLNLPATAVVIGGTRVGFDPQASAVVRSERERLQLLNAVGRAGRPYTAPRSIAIVVPDRPVTIGPDTAPASIRDRVDFLRHEDASTEVRSQLAGFVSQAVDDTLDMTLMSGAEQAAFAFLSFADNDLDSAEVLRRTLAAHLAGSADQMERVASTLRSMGAAFLDAEGAPAWVARASHRAGLGTPEAALLQNALRERLSFLGTPRTIMGWKDVLLDALAAVPANRLGRITADHAYRSTLIAGVFAADEERRVEGWRSLDATLTAWMAGSSLLEVAEAALGRDTRGSGTRGARDPLPKAVGIVNEGFGFGLALAAGAAVALVSVGGEMDLEGPWQVDEEQRRALAALPVAVRLGANSLETLAWLRDGFRHRRAAHLLARLFPPPAGLSEAGLRQWVRDRRRMLVSGSLLPERATEAELGVLAALGQASEA